MCDRCEWFRLALRSISNLKCIAWLLLLLLGSSIPARAQTETVLYTFGTNPGDGFAPAAGLVIDSLGNLFGTASQGSSTLCDLAEVYGCGLVFELAKSPNGYTENVLYSFGTSSAANDGATPLAGLILDAAGNLYGTTTYGGSSNCLVALGSDGCGTVFELVKSSTGYTENLLYTFTGFDGAYPDASLVMDSSGNLYGTASNGGAYGYGVVFELVNSSGTYTETTLYSFGATNTDGTYPVAGLVIDSAGNLYGTTSLDLGPYSCGLASCGIVFELVKTSNGFTEKVLHQFTGADGANPQAGLIMDAAGNLYGTTIAGGAFGMGTVFELVNSSGTYTEKVLYSFGATAADGNDPVASLVLDASGNLYGTTRSGGSTTACDGTGCGTAFELVNSSGTYAERLLHSFSGGSDGSVPASALIMDSTGNLYSTTEVGGSTQQLGTVFMINPAAAAPDATLAPTSLSFTNQLINTSSPAQTITVTNSGKANLVFGPNAVTISGGQASDFAVSTDLCSGMTVVPNAACTVSVTFTPAVAATDTATLNVFDNSVTSLQAAGLTGIGVLANSPVIALSPQSLTFAAQLAATTSSQQTITLTNTGTATLNLTDIVSTTTNFTQTNNCGSSVGVGMSCTIIVTFTPGAGGPLTGFISINGNAPAGAASVNLSGTGEDFFINLATGAPQSITVSPGANAAYSLSLVPTGGFNQTLTLGCSGAPSLANCSVSPSTVTLDGSHSVSLSVNVTTAAAAGLVARPPKAPLTGPETAVTSLFSVTILFLLIAASRSGKPYAFRFACVTVLLAAGFMCTSCGGSSGSSSGSSPNSPGTPAGTYPLTVTGTSGNLTNSFQLTLIVN
jgi:uncharacterized repeat protein (TIGR03803 family)